jgi:hypothetical protein
VSVAAALIVGVAFVVWYDSFSSPPGYPWQPPHPALSRAVTLAFLLAWLAGLPALTWLLAKSIGVSVFSAILVGPLLVMVVVGYGLTFLVSMINCSHNLGGFPLPVHCN